MTSGSAAWVPCLAMALVVSACSADSAPDRQDADSTGRIGFPLAGPPPNGFATKANVGDRFTNGQLVIFNKGDEPLTLLAVEPELSGDGLRFLGAQVAGLDRTLGFTQFEPEYPPAEPMLGDPVEVEHAVIEPGRAAARRGVELLMGFEVTAEGRSTVRSVAVTYRDSAGQHTGRWTATMAVCAPKSTEGECAQEYGDS